MVEGGGALYRVSELCDNDDNMVTMAFSWRYPLADHYATAFCPEWIRMWQLYPRLSTYRAGGGIMVKTLRKTPHLTQMAYSFMPSSVLNELSHDQDILGNNALRMYNSLAASVCLFIIEKRAF